MEPVRCLPNAELTRLQAEQARLAAALQTVARTYRATWEDVMVVSRQLTPIEDALRVALAQQARREAAQDAALRA